MTSPDWPPPDGPSSSSSQNRVLLVALGALVVVLLVVIGALVAFRASPQEATVTTLSSADPEPAAPVSEAAADPVTEQPSPIEAEEPPASESDVVAAATPVEEPVATVEGEIPGASLEVYPLRRDGESVELQVAVVVAEDADNVGFGACTWSTELNCMGNDTLENPDDVADFAGATLVDVANDQRHLVLREAESGECLCTRGIKGRDRRRRACPLLRDLPGAAR